MDRDDYVRLTGDTGVNDLLLWLAPGADAGAVQATLRRLAQVKAKLHDAAAGDAPAETRPAMFRAPPRRQ